STRVRNNERNNFMQLKVNILAVLVAVVVNFAIGFLWYAKLFMRPWTKEMGYDPNIRPDPKTMAKGMVLMVIGNFLFAWILAFYLAGWRFIPGSSEVGAASFALNSAISVWIGFFVP